MVAVDCAREVADIAAPILGWTAADVDREVETYTARVEAEVLSQAQPDDASADALRAGTLWAAELLGLAGTAGVIEPGAAGLGDAPAFVGAGFGGVLEVMSIVIVPVPVERSRRPDSRSISRAKPIRLPVSGIRVWERNASLAEDPGKPL